MQHLIKLIPQKRCDKRSLESRSYVNVFNTIIEIVIQAVNSTWFSLVLLVILVHAIYFKVIRGLYCLQCVHVYIVFSHPPTFHVMTTVGVAYQKLFFFFRKNADSHINSHLFYVWFMCMIFWQL